MSNPEVVARKNSNTTETSSVNLQQLNRQKKTKTNNSDVDSVLSTLTHISISSESKSDSSMTKKMDTVLEGSAQAIRPGFGSLPGTTYFNEEKGRVMRTIIKHPERKWKAHSNLTRCRQVRATESLKPTSAMFNFTDNFQIDNVPAFLM